MTVAEFYAQHAVDGRAVLKGTVGQPERWIARLRGVGGLSYWLCGDEVIDKVVPLDPESPIEWAGTVELADAPRDATRGCRAPGVHPDSVSRRGLRAQGRCPACRKPWMGDAYLCDACRKRDREQAKARRAARRQGVAWEDRRGKWSREARVH